LRRQAETKVKLANDERDQQVKLANDERDQQVKLANEQLAEHMKLANARIEEIEKAREQAESKAKLIDERAKRAIAHANQTIMNFMNSPLDEENTEMLTIENESL